MRTEITSSPALAAARLRAHAVRTRRWLWNLSPAARWGLALVALAAVAGFGYLATPVAPVGEPLYGGQRFGSDEIDAITRALSGNHIKYRVVDMGRIEVASDQVDAATDVVAKLSVVPRSIREMRERANQPSFLESLTDTERRQTEFRAQFLESIFRRLPGVVSANVQINRTLVRGGFRPTPGASVFVYLQTEQNRPIASLTVQSIQNTLVGAIPDLKHDAVTVVDERGHHYLYAGNPALGALSRTRAREEELGRKILDELHWIKGVSVTVQLLMHPAPVESAATSPAPAVARPAPTEGPGPPIGLNIPVELDPAPNVAETSVAGSVASESAGGAEQGKIWVKVPRSFYKSTIQREPSIEVSKLWERNEKLIRTAIDLVVARGESWDVKIDSIPDDASSADPMPIQAASQSRRPVPWWSLAGTAAAVVVMLMVTAYRAVVSRRPVPRRARGTDRGRYPIDAAPESGHVSSERVRELVRFNPEAAAGVLQRWIGQGGHVG